MSDSILVIIVLFLLYFAVITKQKLNIMTDKYEKCKKSCLRAIDTKEGFGFTPRYFDNIKPTIYDRPVFGVSGKYGSPYRWRGANPAYCE